MRKLKNIFISLVLISFPMISFSQVVKYEKNIDGSYKGIYTKVGGGSLDEKLATETTLQGIKSQTDKLLFNGSNHLYVTANDLDIRNLVPSQDGVGLYGWDGSNWQKLKILSSSYPYLINTLAYGTNYAYVINPATDNFSTLYNGVLTLNFLYGFNGAGWDRLRSDTTYGLDVDVTRLPNDIDIRNLNALDDSIRVETCKLFGYSPFEDKWLPLGVYKEVYGGKDVWKLMTNSKLVLWDDVMNDYWNLNTDAKNANVNGYISPAPLYIFDGSVFNRARGDITYGLDVDVTRSALPIGASTEAKQDIGNANLSSIDNKLNSLGQKTMAGSVPVVIASDQSQVPVTGSMTFTEDTLSETIVDLNLADSSTEYSYTLPSSCKEYEFQCEQNVDVRYSSAAGGTNTNYRTLKAGTTWASWGRVGTNYANKTLYFKCPSQNNVVIQITIWNKP